MSGQALSNRKTPQNVPRGPTGSPLPCYHIATMPLQIHYVGRLEDVIDPAVEFLCRDADLFARQRIVVPTAGAKAWLYSELAKRLGASAATTGDGIIANIDISFPGSITALLQPPRDSGPDPWSLDRLTFAVLEVITGTDAAKLGIPYQVSREPLVSARRIAVLFDNYHVRRPGMIREWELSDGNRFLNPTANDEQQDGNPKPSKLRDSDLWQFEVWRAVRRHVGKPSPPARMSVDYQTSREQLLVAGLQSLSLPQLECLERTADVCDVDVLLVHPSPGLNATWTASGQEPLPAGLRGRPLQRSKDPVLPEGVDQLLPVWLAGARDLQELLAAQGVPITHLKSATPREYPATLLGRMQLTIESGSELEPHEHNPVTDRSLVIHRCHSLSRQAEVLHDALLQAFEEIEGLEPHHVAIVSPCIEKAAPHLEAVFQRTVQGRDRSGTERQIKLPLVVADRGIRETSEAADLLVALMALPGSRASIDDVLSVAGHPLVRSSFGIGDDDLATWSDFVERTAVRWGLDADHRARHGLMLPDHPDIHTWKLGLERMLLGVMLPDAAARPELGGVVPLADLDTVDLIPITKLVRILDVIRTLDARTSKSLPAAEWCDAIEQALVGLCGEECSELAEPLAHLRRLREAAAGTSAEKKPVPFEDVRCLLVAWLDEKSGRQPLRTGAITATSMVPLRGVPFKVICVFGYDDGAVGVGEGDGDDLVTRQQLVGEVDPRADERRALLDCLLAAGERLVITCNGRNVKSNKRVPLVTPLAEFVDFAVRHGVARDKLDDLSGIEIEHPRHHLSRRNFEEGGVEREGIWSHDRIAYQVLGTVESERRQQEQEQRSERGDGTATSAEESISGGGTGAAKATHAEPIVTELALLERMVKDPLSLYLKHTLGINVWRKDEDTTPATIPLLLENKQARDLTMDLLKELVLDPAAALAWIEAKQRSGVVPIGPHIKRQVDELIALADGLKSGAAQEDVLNIFSLATEQLGDHPLKRHRLVGTLNGVHVETKQLVVVTAAKAGKDDYGHPLHMATLHLLAARAHCINVEQATIISRRDEWNVGKKKEPSPRFPQPRSVEPWQTRIVKLDEGLMSQNAAAGHLDEIAGLAHEAMKAPRPAFGKVLTSAPAKREEEFEKSLGTDFYGRTSECVLFGVSPSFVDVFVKEPERLRFLDAFKRLLEPVYDKQKKEYRLA